MSSFCYFSAFFIYLFRFFFSISIWIHIHISPLPDQFMVHIHIFLLQLHVRSSIQIEVNRESMIILHLLQIGLCVLFNFIFFLLRYFLQYKLIAIDDELCCDFWVGWLIISFYIFLLLFCLFVFLLFRKEQTICWFFMHTH